ncbi:RsfA family transcriptional regulator [Bacillus marasmi]|uniref:RsfA family transcriptional regulator n=1 Tax=Bacillus marasmi TaxID=1926279 RepID=UPI0011C9EC3D|nr:RsfA family transcriptional regulator [Bacillus marasmi]
MKVRQDAWTDENDLLLAETVLRHVREGSTQLNAFEEVGDKLNRTSAACGFRWNAVVRHQYEKALDLAKKQRKQRQRVLGKDQGGKKKLLYTPPVVQVSELEPVLIGANGMEMEEFANELHVGGSETIISQTGTSQLENQTETAAEEDSHIPAVQVPVTRRLTMPTQPVRTITMDMVIAYLQSFNHSNYQVDILKSENERLKRELADLKKHNQELQGKINHLEQDTETIQEDYETLMKIMNRARKLVLFEEEERPQTTFKMDRNGNLEKMAE